MATPVNQPSGSSSATGATGASSAPASANSPVSGSGASPVAGSASPAPVAGTSSASVPVAPVTMEDLQKRIETLEETVKNTANKTELRAVKTDLEAKLNVVNTTIGNMDTAFKNTAMDLRKDIAIASKASAKELQDTSDKITKILEHLNKKLDTLQNPQAHGSTSVNQPPQVPVTPTPGTPSNPAPTNPKAPKEKQELSVIGIILSVIGLVGLILVIFVLALYAMRDQSISSAAMMKATASQEIENARKSQVEMNDKFNDLKQQMEGLERKNLVVPPSPDQPQTNGYHCGSLINMNNSSINVAINRSSSPVHYSEDVRPARVVYTDRTDNQFSGFSSFNRANTQITELCNTRQVCEEPQRQSVRLTRLPQNWSPVPMLGREMIEIPGSKGYYYNGN